MASLSTASCICFLVWAGWARGALASWGGGSPDSNQYHIQTDEGPERYFRYQTHSGQYRKEKRLQDGTVVGSYGWIDADGFLRLRDYIADDEGYRILKSKTVYVGHNRPIEEAIKLVKKIPAQAGILVGASRPAYPARGTPAYPVRGTPAYAPALASPAPPARAVTPLVLLSHNSVESEYDFRPTVAPIAAERAPAYFSTQHPAPVEETSASYLPPTSTYSPPLSSTYLPPVSSSTYPPPVTASTGSPPVTSPTYLPPVSSSTYLPPVSSSTYLPPVSSSTYLPAVVSSTPAPLVASSTYLPRLQYSSTPSPIVAITSNVLGDYRKKYNIRPAIHPQRTYEPQLSYGDRDLYSTKSLGIDPFNLQSTAIERRDQYVYQKPHTYTAYSSNQLGNGYDPQYPTYDGVAVTNNGFRYYLPKQYHEEENSGSDTRAGSFGYVDPFGIRRVIYYNTSPGSGFVHRKNNRYVGFDATPYDPRPL